MPASVAPEGPHRAGAIRRPSVDGALAAAALAAFLAGSGNMTLARALRELGGDSGAALSVALLVALAAAFNALLQLVVWRPLFKALAVLLLLVTATCAHFLDSYGTLMDASMARNVMQTDAAEVLEIVSGGLLLRVAAFGALPAALLLWTRLERRPLRREVARRLLFSCGSLALALLAAWTQYHEGSFVVRQHRELKLMVNPLTPIFVLVEAGLEAGRGPEGPPLVVASDASRGSPAPGPRTVFVLVVGETARADHFGIFGYGRDTTPELARRDVVAFSDVTACGTSTAESLPCMFSALPRGRFDADEADAAENVLDVLQRVGVSVLWRDNNSGCKGICERVPFERTGDFALAPCGPDGCFDEALLDGLQERLDGSAGDLLVVLHQKGSHGPAYSRRVPEPFARFLPACQRDDVQECAVDEVVNAYDNTILYTDHVLGLVIDLLDRNAADTRTAMLYVSDHGESLGENGIFLHGLPFWMAPDAQTHVPMVVWASDGFLAAQGIDRAALDVRAGDALSHDALFHTLLGVFGVRTAEYDAGLDVFGPCRVR